MFEELLKNPLLKKALEAGEARAGKVVAAMLSSERVAAGLQAALASAVSARAALEKGLRTAMQAVNLPTTEDVAELKQRLAELESLIDGLAARLERDGGAAAAEPAPGEEGAAEPEEGDADAEGGRRK